MNLNESIFIYTWSDLLILLLHSMYNSLYICYGQCGWEMFMLWLFIVEQTNRKNSIIWRATMQCLFRTSFYVEAESMSINRMTRIFLYFFFIQLESLIYFLYYPLQFPICFFSYLKVISVKSNFMCKC